MKYWKQGFHLAYIEGSVGVEDDYWQELLEGQSKGRTIEENENGYPILVDRVRTQQEMDWQEIATLKAYLDETDYIYPKCLELQLEVNLEYSDVVQKRKEARERIRTLTQVFGGMGDE